MRRARHPRRRDHAPLTLPRRARGAIPQLPATWEERYEYAPQALWTAHDNAVFDVAWTERDSRLVTASGDQRARLWDVETQALLASLRGHAGSLKSVSVRPDEPWAVATGARDGTFCLWDTRDAPRPVARSNSMHILPAALYKVRLSNAAQRARADAAACHLTRNLAFVVSFASVASRRRRMSRPRPGAGARARWRRRR